jgi:hypothetical protein
MSVDDYLKGKETTPCPISSDATGNMVVRGLYKNPVGKNSYLGLSNQACAVLQSLQANVE